MLLACLTALPLPRTHHPTPRPLPPCLPIPSCSPLPCGLDGEFLATPLLHIHTMPLLPLLPIQCRLCLLPVLPLFLLQFPTSYLGVLFQDICVCGTPFPHPFAPQLACDLHLVLYTYLVHAISPACCVSVPPPPVPCTHFVPDCCSVHLSHWPALLLTYHPTQFAYHLPLVSPAGSYSTCTPSFYLVAFPPRFSLLPPSGSPHPCVHSPLCRTLLPFPLCLPLAFFFLAPLPYL